MAIDTSRRANVTAIIGSTGSGKGSRMKWILGRERYDRLAIFDPEGEYGEFGTVVNTLGELVALLKKTKFRAVFVPSENDKAKKIQFEIFCQAVAGDDDGIGGECAVVVDELAEVTTPSWAPAGWRKVCNKGRKRGLIVYGMSQFPAQVDKAFWGACTTIFTGRLITPAHAKAMGEQIGVRPDEIRSLSDLEYMEMDVRTGQLTRGAGKYLRGKPVY